MRDQRLIKRVAVGVAVLVLAIGGVQAWKLSRQSGPGPGFVSGNGRIEAVEVDIATRRPGRYGRIVNISSINGRKGQAGQSNYAAAKAGILGFTRSLALEGASRNITVNAVAPGYCDTAMVAAVRPEVLQTIVAGIPVGRLGEPGDVARLVAFLAGEGAGFITGASFDVNGGQYMA